LISFARILPNFIGMVNCKVNWNVFCSYYYKPHNQKQGGKMILGKKKDVVGLDIGSSSIKLVELREGKGGFKLQNLAISPLPPEAIVDGALMDSVTIINTIKDLIATSKAKTKEVVTSVSGHSVIVKKITLPLMTEAELEESIQWEAERYIPFDINDVNIDFQISGYGVGFESGHY
jgi:type IV pilus assembly protein PilM